MEVNKVYQEEFVGRAKLKIYNADCMDYMRNYKDNEFDLAIVDPPYGNNFGKRHIGRGWIVRESKEWDTTIPNKEYFSQLFKISKNQIIWGGNYFVQFLFYSQGWIFWDKGQRNFSLADGELAFTSFDRALRVFTYSRGKMQAVKTVHFHPTQKPIALYKWLLKNYAKQGDKILDTHFGSGSIAIACWDMEFDLTAFEIDKDYFEAAIKRIKEHTAQRKLF